MFVITHQQIPSTEAQAVMSKFKYCFLTLFIATALSYRPVAAQDMIAFVQPPVMSEPALQATEDQLFDENEIARLPARLQKHIVEYPTHEAAGTIIIDTPETFLYYVLGDGKAMRYGIGVGRHGFTWSGVRSIIRKAEWPDWYPPADMIERQPYLPRMVAGGPGNPLGARAMYIGGTEYRIHGTNDPTSIGKYVSSGCIRLTNDNIIDLYNRVKIGAKVIVLPMERQQRLRTSPVS
jgi:lipoprotein-anchoring transpeptidase ErfK/SrfK